MVIVFLEVLSVLEVLLGGLSGPSTFVSRLFGF